MIGRVGRVEVLGIQDWTSCRWVSAVGNSEFGLCGMVGGITMVVACGGHLKNGIICNR